MRNLEVFARIYALLICIISSESMFHYVRGEPAAVQQKSKGRSAKIRGRGRTQQQVIHDLELAEHLLSYQIVCHSSTWTLVREIIQQTSRIQNTFKNLEADNEIFKGQQK